ncbi:MAG: DNA polymerase III subunit delta' [Candidatus Omnitrophica bacterium]|nr:DNA polymerase III subunit delta' [Candidatus Omnitrophota bacterium]
MPFADIKGQDKAVGRLKEYLRHGRLASAYLFLGPDGVGKFLAARTLAKAVNCQEGDFDSCDKCASCLKIEKGAHPDVHIIGRPIEDDPAASETVKIEEIRQLQKEINLKPYEGKCKVFIIDNAHRLTPEASGALLKTLEEPPGNSLIILLSSKPALLFKTIISRCQVLKFFPLPRIRLKEVLRKDYHFDGHEAHFLAYFCEGRLGYAVRLKELDIFKEKNRIIEGLGSPGIFALGDEMAESRESLRQGLNILAAWFRDIYMIKSGSSHKELINFDRREQLLRLMNRYSFGELDEILKYISDSLLYLEQNINVKLLLSNLKYLMKG